MISPGILESTQFLIFPKNLFFLAKKSASDKFTK